MLKGLERILSGVEGPERLDGLVDVLSEDCFGCRFGEVMCGNPKPGALQGRCGALYCLPTIH